MIPPGGANVPSFQPPSNTSNTNSVNKQQPPIRPNAALSTSKVKPHVQLSKETGCSCVEVVGTLISLILFVVTFPIAVFLCFKSVQEYQRAVIFRQGRIRRGGARGPGVFFILPCIDEYICLDLRTVTYDIPPQEVLTKDSMSVAVDAVMYYRVSNPVVAVVNVANYKQSTHLLAATTLRNVLGTRTMSEILSQRDSIAAAMQITLDEATDPWGVKVERVEIKDVRIPAHLQRSMAAEAEASREANAKVIAAEGEKQASKSLKEASDMMTGSPGALQLRYLQALNTISSGNHSVVLFPLPIELLRAFR